MNATKKKEMLLKSIEHTRRTMMEYSTLYPLHSTEVIMISKQLDKLLNEYDAVINCNE